MFYALRVLASLLTTTCACLISRQQVKISSLTFDCLLVHIVDFAMLFIPDVHPVYPGL